MRSIYTKTVALITRWIRKRWFRVVVAIIGVVVGALFLLPLGLSYGIRSWYLAHGAEEVSLANIDFNPFKGTISIENLNVVAAKKRALTIPYANLKFAWWPMWHKELVFHQIMLRDAEIVISKTPARAWHIGGYRATETGRVTEQTPWSYQVTGIALDNCRIRLDTKDAHFRLGIKKAHLSSSFSKTTGINLSGKVAANQIRLDLSDYPDLLSVQGATVDFRLASAKAGDIGLGGTLHITDAKARILSNGEDLRSEAGRLSLSGIEVHWQDGINIARADIVDMTIAAAARRKQLFKANQIILKQFNLRDLNKYAINSITVSGIQAFLRRDRTGHWEIPVFAAAKTSSDKSGSRASVRINRINFYGGRVFVNDVKVTPAFKSDVTVRSLSLSGINSRRSQTPANLRMEGNIGKHSPFSINGQLFPFKRPVDLNLSGKFTAIDLPPISPYAIDRLGYTINAGHMDADVGMETRKGALSGQTRLNIKDLELKERDPTKAKQLTSTITMPLDSAVALLQDKEKRINLTIDLSGNITDPKFSFADAINQALLKSIQFASVSYLKWYFQPYGTLITIVQTAEKAAQIKLDPIAYRPGEDLPTEAAYRYLDKITDLMRKNTHMTLKVCGKATPEDMPYVRHGNEAALELARRRAENVKEYLITEGKIIADRIVVCAPQLDTSTERQPRVELYL